MPFLNRISTGSSRKFGWSKISRLAAFLDTFNRGNSANTVGGDTPWTAVSGTWGITSSAAVTSTAASSYPVLAVDVLSPEVTVRATLPTSASGGAGVAFWVTDNNNWWAAIANKVDYSAAPYNCPSGGSANNSTGNCTYNTTGGGPYPAVSGGNGPYCYCNAGTVFGCGCFYYYESPANWWTYSHSASYACCTFYPYTYYVQPAPYNYTATTYGGTPTSYNRSELKVLKKTAGSVSTVSNTTVSTNTASHYLKYVQVATSANAATVTTQDSANVNSSAPSVTVGTPVPASKFGIIFAPSDASSSSSVDSFELYE